MNKDKKIAPAVQLSGLTSMATRLRTVGGVKQQNRMIDSKLWSLQHAVKYSYQGAEIREVDTLLNYSPALINPNKLKPDYDDKVLSVEFKYGFKAGDVFEWKNTGTKWIIYLQDLTELAYFRGDIRRCSYYINIKDSDGKVQKIYAAIRGPVETKIRNTLKNKMIIDTPNHSLDLLMPKNKLTLEYFERYAKFYLRGLAEGDKPTCWHVTATDSISMPGVLQITAVEYYANKDTDDIENGIVDGLIVEPIPAPSLIKGPRSIKPLTAVKYTYVGKDSNWIVDKDSPIEYTIDGNEIVLNWTSNYSGNFVLQNNETTLLIEVESLF